MPAVQGCYVDKHNHEIGTANIAYTCLSGSTWEQIKSMLWQRIDHCEIVSCRNQNSLATDLIYLKACMVREMAPEGSHDQLVALKEVNQIAQVLESHKIRLHQGFYLTSYLKKESSHFTKISKITL